MEQSLLSTKPGCIEVKMYSEKRMLELIEKAGLKLQEKYENVGVHDYTLLEVAGTKC